MGNQILKILASPFVLLLPLISLFHPAASSSPPLFPSLSVLLHTSLLLLTDLLASLSLTTRGKGYGRLLPSYAASTFPPGEMALPLSPGVSLPTPQGAGRPDLAEPPAVQSTALSLLSFLRGWEARPRAAPAADEEASTPGASSETRKKIRVGVEV